MCWPLCVCLSVSAITQTAVDDLSSILERLDVWLAITGEIVLVNRAKVFYKGIFYLCNWTSFADNSRSEICWEAGSVSSNRPVDSDTRWRTIKRRNSQENLCSATAGQDKLVLWAGALAEGFCGLWVSETCRCRYTAGLFQCGSSGHWRVSVSVLFDLSLTYSYCFNVSIPVRYIPLYTNYIQTPVTERLALVDCEMYICCLDDWYIL